MHLTLRIPGQQDKPWTWRLPRSWVDLFPDSKDFETAYGDGDRSLSLQAYLTSASNTMDDKLLRWSRTVECSVDHVLRTRQPSTAQDLPPLSLPRAFRGRCEPRRRIQGVIPQLPKKGRSGDIQPVCETTSVNSRQRLGQCRRLATLHKGLLKMHRSLPAEAMALRMRLLQQWEAVLRAPGYAGGFPSWVLSWPGFSALPQSLPSSGVVYELLQFVQFDYKAHTQQEAQARAESFRYRLHIDHSALGGSQSFARVRPSSFPPFTKVASSIQSHVQQTHFRSFLCRHFTCRDASRLPLYSEVLLAGCVAQVCEIQHDGVVLQFRDEDQVIPFQGVLQHEGMNIAISALHIGVPSGIGTAGPRSRTFLSGLNSLTWSGTWRRRSRRCSCLLKTLRCGFMLYVLSTVKEPRAFQVGPTATFAPSRMRPSWTFPVQSAPVCMKVFRPIACRLGLVFSVRLKTPSLPLRLGRSRSCAIFTGYGPGS